MPLPEDGAPAQAEDPTLGPDHLAHLGAGLRALYREVVAEPMPDRFLKLLDSLARDGATPDDR